MFTDLGNVVLKSGESVEAAVITGPDPAWRERISGFLGHKGGIWNWQVGEQVSRDLGVDSDFYLLHRDGVPFSHIMTTTLHGVGLLGHVFTVPEERGQGAASLLMGKQLEHFRELGGRALYLSTGYDTSPYHIYRKHGFEGIGNHSGCMTYSVKPLADFEAEYFAPGEVTIEPLSWKHWPSSAALFMQDAPGQIRNLSLKQIGRSLVEGPFLPEIRYELENHTGGYEYQSYVAQKQEGGAVVGLSTRRPDPLWPETDIIDIYCHADHWQHSDALVQPLVEVGSQRLLAYAEIGFTQKEEALARNGFEPIGVLPKQLCLIRGVKHQDVGVYEY